jgi:hypothetical protein
VSRIANWRAAVSEAFLEEPSLQSLKPSYRERLCHRRPEFTQNGGGLRVGATGFEPATTCTPSKCATRLRHAPEKTGSTLLL